MGKVNAILIYNSCCPFCVRLSFWIRSQVGPETLEIAPNNKFDFKSINMDKETFEKDVHLILYDEKKFIVSSKGEAIIDSMSLNMERFGTLVWHYRKYRIIKLAFDFGYLALKKIKPLINRIFYHE